MATTPECLNSTAASLKIDNTDMHVFGMIVNKVHNPVPKARRASISIPGKSGDFDYAKVYETRYITISGSIVGDTHAQLTSNLDELKNWLRLRMDSSTLEVIFQDQTDRYWTCKYNGEFLLEPTGLWKGCLDIKYTLVLKCVKPYAEKTTVTNELVTNFNIFRKKVISYSGTVPTPLNITLWPHIVENLFEKDGGSSEATTGWSVTNGTLSTVEGGNSVMYGSKSVKNTGDGNTPSVIYRDIYSSIDTDNYYVVFAYIRSDDSTDVYLNVTGDVALDKDGNTLKDTTNWGLSFIKLQPSDFSGESQLNIRIMSDTANVTFLVDGVAVYEITSDEYEDNNYVPPPYTSQVSGGRHLVNPKFYLLNSINLLKYGKGDDDGDAWHGMYGAGSGSLHIIQDPFNPDEKCFFVRGEYRVTTPIIYVNPNKDYHLRFDYYSSDLSVSDILSLDIIERSEIENYTASLNVWNASAPVSEWTEMTYQLDRNTLGAPYLMFQFYPTSTGMQIFLKNIQVVEVETHSSDVDDYVDYSELKLESAGLTLDSSDILVIDSERMVQYFFDSSENSMNNAAQYFSGNRLVLRPNTNILFMRDARVDDSTSPEDESIGAVKKMILSYRERYL